MAKKPALSYQDLTRELETIREFFPKLSDDNIFVLWFLRAFITEDMDIAAKALCGKKGDKGTDAILIDERAKIVFVIQAKYRQSISNKLEKRTDVSDFADLSWKLTGTKEDFSTIIKSATPETRIRLEEARNRIIKRGYCLHLYYVTLGKCSRDLEKEAIDIVRQAERESKIEVFSGNRILLLLSDYLEGVAPPVPSVELEMESGSGVKVNGILQRYDSKTDIDSWVFSMSGYAIAEVYEKCGPRLFARNVRGFLGDTDINRGMEETLINEPEYFWYYNNGITIVCDSAVKRSSKGKDILHVENPQIINGQQTTRTLHRKIDKMSKASVIIRVIRVPREAGGNHEDFENLVSNIVGATNWQNAIRPSDLMSNDRRQIEIERAFRKLSYLYLRKRQSRSEAKSIAGANHFFTISKEELAQSVAACDLDPSILRLGKETLFEEDYYKITFPTGDPDYYLNRYWVMKKVTNAAHGYPERAYAKWLVVHFIWKSIGNQLRSNVASLVFQNECKRSRSLAHAIEQMADTCFKSALLFFRKKRGSGETAIDVSTFFKRKRLHDDFESFWRGSLNKHRNRFHKDHNKFQIEFKAASK